VQPEFEEEKIPSIGVFQKDTRRRYLNLGTGSSLGKGQTALMDPNDPDVKEEMEKLQAGPASSPGKQVL
jgi:hypothetical protein